MDVPVIKQSAHPDPAAAGKPKEGEQGKLERLTFDVGQRIFSQGEMGDAAYIVNKGRILLYQTFEGQKIEIGEVTAGNIFGEMAVLDGGTRSASAIAAEPCELSRVPLQVFNQKLEKTDRFLRALIELIIRNIRNSPKLFLRRPRSVKDNLHLIRSHSFNLRRYAGKLEEPGLADEWLDQLDKLDAIMKNLTDLTDRSPDKRHDLIIGDDQDGVDYAEVIGSEGQRVL